MTSIETVSKEIVPIAKQVSSFKVSNKDDMTKSVELLSRCNKYLDKLTEEKEKITKPMNEALKEVRSRYKPITDQLESVIVSLRSEQSKYMTEQVRIEKEKEAKIEARVKLGKGNLTLETAVKKMDEIDTADQMVSTGSGIVKFKTVKKFEVMDISMLTPEYLLPNDVAIREAMKADIQIAGVRYYEEQVPVNFR